MEGTGTLERDLFKILLQAWTCFRLKPLLSVTYRLIKFQVDILPDLDVFGLKFQKVIEAAELEPDFPDH